MNIKKAIFLKLLRLKVMAWNRSEKANMLISLSSPRAVIAHFRYQRSTGTTRRTTGESSIAPEPSYRGRGPASGEKIDRSMAITVHACAFNLHTRVRYSAVWTFRILTVTRIVRTCKSLPTYTVCCNWLLQMYNCPSVTGFTAILCTMRRVCTLVLFSQSVVSEPVSHQL